MDSTNFFGHVCHLVMSNSLVKKVTNMLHQGFELVDTGAIEVCLGMRKSTFICKFKILDISKHLSSLSQNLEDERHITETFHILLERALIEGCEKNSRNQKND